MKNDDDDDDGGGGDDDGCLNRITPSVTGLVSTGPCINKIINKHISVNITYN